MFTYTRYLACDKDIAEEIAQNTFFRTLKSSNYIRPHLANSGELYYM